MSGKRQANLMTMGLLIGMIIQGGCADIRITDPARTATEQYLMSQAIAMAVDQLGADMLPDRRIYVKGDLLDVPHASYLIAAVRARLLEHGVRLVPEAKQAEIVVELRSQGVGIDRSENLVGLPAVLLPAGSELDSFSSGTIITPEIAFYKKIHQQGYASVAFAAYWQDTGEIVGSDGPVYGYTQRIDEWIFGVGPTSTGNIVTTETRVPQAP